MKGTRPYYIWHGMIARCTSPKPPGYPDYGGRGIKVTPEWAAKPGGFIAFWRDMGPTYQPGLTLERNDVNGDYTPENCSRATQGEQQLNRRNARIIDTPKGPMNITTAARLYGLKVATLKARIYASGSLEWIFRPVQRPGRPPTINPNASVRAG